MKKRESSLELLRFIYAMVIAYYNGCFFNQNTVNENAQFATAFFFILSGFFLVPTIEKYMDYPMLIALKKFLVDKLKKLGIPLLIAYIFSIATTIQSKTLDNGILHLLWFVHILLIYELMLLFFYKRINNESNFLLLIFIIYIGTLSARLFTPLKEFKEFECFVLVSSGVLISLMKMETGSKNPSSFILLLITFLCSILVLFFTTNELYELILKFIGFPVMILSAYTINIENRFFNYLGRLSPLLYFYTPVFIFINSIFPLNSVIIGILLIVISVITELLTSFYKKKCLV